MKLQTKYKYVFVLLLFVFCCSAIKAQLVADFEVRYDSGCAPFVGIFQDSSIGPITYRHWDFGNGNVSVGNITNPNAIYGTPGIYDVTLTVSDGFDTATITKLAAVSVFGNPTASFNHQNTLTGCASFPFQVVDNSTIASAPIVSWRWDFDDGTPLDTNQSNTHLYQSPGLYNVSLIVVDGLGCTSSKVKTSLVTVKPKPVADFYSTDSLSVCGPPLTVNITNASTSSHPLTYSWLVGGVSYNTLNVNPTFTNSGGYDAELVVVNSIGCSDTMSVPNYIWIGAIVASMNIPDTVCLGASAGFKNTSFGGSTFDWNFGDGFTGSGDSTDHTYNTTGLHTVTLMASSGSTCDDTTSQTLFVESVTANFSSTPHVACETPMTVNFTDLSQGNIVGWEWRFGNLIGTAPKLKPNIQTVQNPINVYGAAGTYDDTLIIVSANGCMDTLIKLINEEIIVTEALWGSDVVKGCAPLTVDFTNLTDSVSRMATWWWEFDDGSPLDYTFSPNHIFTNVGEYDVTLTVVSIDGCTTLYTNEIKVGALQNANFFPDTVIACGTDTLTFTNISTDTSLITDFVWLFGDGKSDGSFEPWHVYEDTGYMDVTLIALYNGCADTLVIDSALQILGPIVNFYATYNCDTQNVVDFHPLVLGGTNYLWDFGDSTALDSINDTPQHAYPILDSNYVANYTVFDTNSGCSQSVSELIRIRYLEGVVTPADTTFCKGDNIVFNTGNSTNAIAFVRWSVDGFNNQKVDNSNTDFTFPVKGPHTVYAIVLDEHGCMDTASHDVYVYEPIASFGINNAISCAPANIVFTDNSLSDTNVVSWNWDLDNGVFSTLQNPTHVFNGNGTTTYDIKLTVTDTFGCVNELDSLLALLVVEPPSFFNSSDTQMCEFSDIAFTSQPLGNYSYFWDFDDGTTSWVMNPVHQYTTHGLFDISLTITDSLGCDSTFTRANFIDVQNTPNADFIANPTVTDCFPASINFTDQSTYQNIDFWTWNFGDSPNDVTLFGGGAQNLYTQPGFYDVMMAVTTTYGCSDTIVKFNFIHIGGPTGNITFNPEIGCVDQEVMFSADSINGDAERFIWDFGDGVVDTTFAPLVDIDHLYGNTGVFNVSLLITDLQGLCQLTDTISIEIDEVIADFILTDSAGCIPLSFDVMNNSTGEDEITWFLNGSSYSQSQLDSFLIQNSGIHEIQLIALSNYSQCADTMISTVEVFPLPELSITPDAIICIEDTLQLNASGAFKYVWTPNMYLSSDTVPNPISTPLADITYYVQGIDINNCSATDSVKVMVQLKPDLTWITMDTSIFIGAEFQLNTLANLPINYAWSPEYGMGCSDCPNPTINPDSTTTYTLVYQDLNGCFEFDTSVTVEVLDEFKVSIPNTFTPGSDNLNDTFFPVIYGIEEMMYMRIFDRWGTLVYETEDITQGWDGTFKGEIAAHNSAFSYTVRVRRYNGEVKDYVGVVILLTNGL